jgi:hypothetical protein
MNQFVVAEGSSASLSPAQQARVEMFADGMDRESAGGVEWKDLQHWQMGTELVSARELPAESFILVPNESPAEEGRIDFPFLSRTCLWVLKVTNVTVVSNVRAQLFVVGSLFEGCIDPIFAAGAQYSAALPLQSVVLMLIPGFAIFKSVADVFAARHSPQQHAVIPDPEDDGSRKRKACDPVVESSEDGEESAGEDGALPSRRLATSGKRFHDLDGVSLDKRLFVLFIKCLWSPYDWSGLSLDKLLCDEDRAVVWRDESSMVGRSRLARALSNLSRMTFVHFGSVFEHPFSDLAVFVESDPDHLLASVHDIVLRFYMEVIILG